VARHFKILVCRGELVLRLGIKVTRGVALVQLARGVTVSGVHIRPRFTAGRWRMAFNPAQNVLVFVNSEELAHSVKPYLCQLAISGKNRHIGDGVGGVCANNG